MSPSRARVIEPLRKCKFTSKHAWDGSLIRPGMQDLEANRQRRRRGQWFWMKGRELTAADVHHRGTPSERKKRKRALASFRRSGCGRKFRNSEDPKKVLQRRNYTVGEDVIGTESPPRERASFGICSQKGTRVDRRREILKPSKSPVVVIC
jgi:hypothetical protein